jgi:transposase-like protein
MDEEFYKTELFRIRWPEGFLCTRCGCTRYYPISGRGQYECARCGRQFSITGGTCMHRTRLPLSTWFKAAAVYSAGRDISAAEFARKLELAKPTAWRLLKKIKQGLTGGERVLLGKIASVYLAKAHET